MEMTEVQGVVPVASAPPGKSSRVWVERADLRTRLGNEGALLVLAATVIALSLALPALRSRHVWINIPCLFNKVTGLPCLLCGLTRSFVHSAHGHFTAALEMHLLGPLLFGLTVAAVVYLAGSLASGYRVRFAMAPRTRRIAYWSVLGVFVICWAIKLVFMRGTW